MIYILKLSYRQTNEPTDAGITYYYSKCHLYYHLSDSQMTQSDLQYCLDLGRDVSLLVQLDALCVGSCRALPCDLLQFGQYDTVGLGHSLELFEQKLQQFQQQPVDGARESRKGRTRWGNEGEEESEGELSHERHYSNTDWISFEFRNKWNFFMLFFRGIFD